MEQRESYGSQKSADIMQQAGILPTKQALAYDTGQPEYTLYPASGSPPPAQVIHTHDPTIYKQDEDFQPLPSEHTVVIVDGYSQQQTLMQKQGKRPCCFMTMCALCLCCILYSY